MVEIVEAYNYCTSVLKDRRKVFRRILSSWHATSCDEDPNHQRLWGVCLRALWKTSGVVTDRTPQQNTDHMRIEGNQGKSISCVCLNTRRSSSESAEITG